MSETIGFIGLGTLGLPIATILDQVSIATNLLNAGSTLL